MFGKLTLLALLVSCVACAKPKYADAIVSTPQGAAAAPCEVKFEKSGLCLQWAWEVAPGESDFGSLIFKTLREESGQWVPADLSGTAALVLWMPSMGHGSSPTTVTRLESGTYRASRVYFVMPGAWDLRFQNKSGNSVIDEAVVSIILE